VGDNNGRAAVIRGNGDGTFGAATLYPLGAFGGIPHALAAGDLNGDGKLDLVTVNQRFGSPGSVTVLLGDGTGAFQPGTNVQTTVTADALRLALADFNSDGKLDVAVCVHDPSAGDVEIFLGKGDG